MRFKISEHKISSSGSAPAKKHYAERATTKRTLNLVRSKAKTRYYTYFFNVVHVLRAVCREVNISSSDLGDDESSLGVKNFEVLNMFTKYRRPF